MPLVIGNAHLTRDEEDSQVTTRILHEELIPRLITDAWQSKFPASAKASRENANAPLEHS
jgi:hypothetical protein